METPPVPQALLQHGQFVRALARSLLRDAHAAEDVAQETWKRYFEHRPAEEHGLRRWLRTVARNLAANRSRTERSRAARDEEAARPEAVLAAESELEQTELLRAVVEAVLALDEPYCETILARYWRGLDPAQVAAESGTSAGTVRSREQRALEKLRERLDRRSRGDRAAWVVALARFTGPPVGPDVSAPAPRLASNTGVRLAAALALAVLVVVALRSLSPQSISVTDPVASASGVPASPSSVPAPLADPRGPAIERTALAGESMRRENANVDELAEIYGRFVFSGGAPAAHVAIEMMGWCANEERKLLYGEPEDWVDPCGETDDDGRFRLRFAPPRAFQFTLDAKSPGHARASWSWAEILPGIKLDLGQVELLPVGGTIEGRIVDAQGAPLVGEEWTVYARTVGLGEGEGRNESQVVAFVDRATGTFRLEHVWPGQQELLAYSEMANWIHAQSVAVRSGETTTADIVYSGPSSAKRITVITISEPFYVMCDPGPEHIRLVGPASETRGARKIPGSSQSYTFDDLPHGTYALEIDDPRYVRWSRTGLTPGQSVDAHLVGNAALQLSVIDAAGLAVERYAVRVKFRNVGFLPDEFEVHDGRTALADGLVRGMFPGDYDVAIRCADGATGLCKVDGLASGEVRTVRLELGRQRFVSGRVVHADGEGVSGVEVLLLTPAERDDSDASPILDAGLSASDESRYRKQLQSLKTGAGGAFRVNATSAGPFLLRARAHGSQTFSPLFTLDPLRDDLELVLPQPGSVRGHVRGPAGSIFQGLALWIAPRALCSPDPMGGTQQVDQMRESLDHALATLGVDGAFVLTHLPPGPSKAYLVLAEPVRHGFTISDGRVNGSLELAEFDVPPGGELERDFEPLEMPGSVGGTLRVNGEPAPFVGLTLRGGGDPGARTDQSGRFGPVRALAGVWSVWAQDAKAGWSGMISTTIHVEAGRELSVQLELQVGRGTLLCIDANGQPIASEYVTVLRARGRGWSQVTTRKTDASGRLAIELVPGEYALKRGGYEHKVTPGIVPLTWTASGSIAERVQF